MEGRREREGDRWRDGEREREIGGGTEREREIEHLVLAFNMEISLTFGPAFGLIFILSFSEIKV